MRYTKIVCTIGPACNTDEKITALIEAGMNVARLNFSHGTHDDHAANVARIRRVANRLNRPVAILQDLQGPKIRTGWLTDHQPVELVDGAEFMITQFAGRQHLKHQPLVRFPGSQAVQAVPVHWLGLDAQRAEPFQQPGQPGVASGAIRPGRDDAFRVMLKHRLRRVQARYPAPRLHDLRRFRFLAGPLLPRSCSGSADFTSSRSILRSSRFTRATITCTTSPRR